MAMAAATTSSSASSADSKLARFRQLMDAKRLREEGATPSSATSSARPTPFARPTTAPASARVSTGSRTSSVGASARIFSDCGARGAATNLNRELELERRPVAAKENSHPNADGGGVGVGGAGGNLAAMKQIMARRKGRAQDARRRLDDAGCSGKRDDAGRQGVGSVNGNGIGDGGNRSGSDESGSASESLSRDEGSSWAMLQHKLNETTMDRVDESLELAITPEKWQWRPRSDDTHSSITSIGASNGCGGDGLVYVGGARTEATGVTVGSGASGVLSLLGESPIFDRSLDEDDEEGDDDEAARDLTRSAETVRRLERRLLGRAEKSDAAGTDSSGEGEGREREVTFALEGGWATPCRDAPERATYPKSPFAEKQDEGATTPSSKADDQQQANPLNESVVISDDEASVDGDVPLPYGGTFDEDDDEFEPAAASARGAPHPAASLAPSRPNHSSPSAGSHTGGPRKGLTPTRAALLARNETLNREVRFADQTCVELSERKRHYKDKARELTKSLAAASRENAALREEKERALREAARSGATVEAWRERIEGVEEGARSARSASDEAEERHRAYSRELEGRIAELDGRLKESLVANAALRSELDEGRGGESKDDATSAAEAFQKRISEMRDLCDKKQEELRREREEREAIEHDRDGLHRQLMEWARTSSDTLGDGLLGSLEQGESQGESMEDGLEGESKERTPARQLRLDSDDYGASGGHLRTPTSNLLARTLRSELRRREAAFERLERAELRVKRLEEETSELRMDREESRAENLLLEEQVEELEIEIEEKKDEIALLNDRIEALMGARGDGSDESDDPSLPPSDEGSDSRNAGEDGTDDREDTASVLREKLEAVEETLEYADEELTETKAKLSDTQELLDRTAGQLDQSQAELARARATADELVAELEEREAECDEMGEQLKQSKGQVEELSKALEESEAECDGTADKLQQSEEELTEARGRVDKLSRALEESEAKCKETVDKLKQTEEDVAEARGRVDELKVECENATKFSDFQTSTLEAMKEQLSRSDTLNVELRVQLNSCFRALAALEKILRAYEDADDGVGRFMAEQGRRVSRLLETLRQFIQERNSSSRDSSSGQESSIESDDSRSTTTVASMNQDQLDQLREDIAAAKAERDSANEQLEKAQDCLQEFRAELSNQESEHLQETASLKRQCVELEAKLSAVTKDLSEKEGKFLQERSFLKKSCEELEAKLSAATSDLEATEKENESLREAAANSDNELSMQLSVIRSNNADLIQENEKLRVDLQGCAFQLENETTLLHAARDEAVGYRQNAQNAKAAFEILTTECDLTKTSLKDREQECQGLREELARREQKLRDSQDSLSKAEESFQEQIKSLNRRREDLETKLMTAENDRTNAEASLDDASKHIATLEEALKTKEDESREKESECQDLIVRINEVQNGISEVEKDKAEAESTIERLENEIKEKKSVLFAYEESILNYKDEIRRLRNELTTTVSEKDNRIKMLEQACNSRQTLFDEQLERTKKERDVSNAELNDMIERLQTELQTRDTQQQQSSDRFKATVQNLQDELLVQNDALKNMEREINRKQGRLDEEIAKYENVCRELEEAGKEILRVNDKLDSFQMDCERMATEHQDQVEEISDQRNLLDSEKKQLEEQIYQLRVDMEEIEETKDQQSKRAVELSDQVASLQKKSAIFKDKVKLLNQKNKAWEDSYNAQSDDLVKHTMEISRLNRVASELNAQLIRQGPSRHVNRDFLAAQTPQGRTSYLNHPGTM